MRVEMEKEREEKQAISSRLSTNITKDEGDKLNNFSTHTTDAHTQAHTQHPTATFSLMLHPASTIYVEICTVRSEKRSH